MDLSQKITVGVEVVYALPHKQLIVNLEVPAGTTVREAAMLSGIDAHFDDVDLQDCPLGVFGNVVDDSRVAERGDRIELYRPLIADPKESRRQRAAADQDSMPTSTTRTTTSSSK